MINESLISFKFTLIHSDDQTSDKCCDLTNNNNKKENNQTGGNEYCAAYFINHKMQDARVT